MIRVNELKFQLDEPFSEAALRQKILKKTKLKTDQLHGLKIVRESIDARKGIVFSYVVDIETNKAAFLNKNGFSYSPAAFSPIDLTHREKLNQLTQKDFDRPIVIGFGPGGIFAALQLARAGLRPIVLEMGEPVVERQKTVDHFWLTGVLNPKSNVQFGEGGAGTFSDGKLTTRIKDQRIEFVLSQMVESGAPEEIIYKNKPHIGTDLLSKVVVNLRNEIRHLGGEVNFGKEVVDFTSKNESVDVICSDGSAYASKYVVLAVGHSARNLFEKLRDFGLSMEKKPFAMGVRIEHPQTLIDTVQYGKFRGHEKLGAAEYKLTYGASNGRSVYSFCMCPGGRVVGSASEEGGLVVNGMSYHSRSLANANSALLVNITPDDFESEDVLAGMYLQKKMEKLAYDLGGGNFVAPVEKLETFLNLTTDENAFKAKIKINECNAYFNEFGINYENVMSDYSVSYTPGIRYSDLSQLFPPFMYNAIAEAIHHFGKQIPGYDDPRIVVTAVESRSSSPIRMIREPETLKSVSHPYFYPCGEGAGYAGGITSSAVDGVKVAERIIEDLIIRQGLV